MYRDLTIKAHKLTKSMKQFLNNKIRSSNFKHIVFKIILVLNLVLIIIETQIN